MCCSLKVIYLMIMDFVNVSGALCSSLAKMGRFRHPVTLPPFFLHAPCCRPRSSWWALPPSIIIITFMHVLQWVSSCPPTAIICYPYQIRFNCPTLGLIPSLASATLCR